MALAQVSWENNEIQRAMNLLEEAKPGAGQTDRRQWEWYYLNRLLHSEIWTARGHSGTGTAWSVDITSDGTMVATGGGGNLYFQFQDKQPGETILWDFETGKELARLEGHKNQVKHVRFQPNGNRLISIGYDGDAIVWNVDTKQEVGRLPASFGRCEAAEFSKDGKQLLVFNRDNKVWLLDPMKIADPRLIAELPSSDCISFSPDATQFVTIDGSRHLHNEDATLKPTIWNVKTGKQMAELDSPRDYAVITPPDANLVRWSPDGKRVVAGLGGGVVSIWDVKTGVCQHSLKVTDSRSVCGLQFSADGQFVVCGSDVAVVYVVDVVSGEVVAEYKGHTNGIREVTFSPDDGRLVSVDVSGNLKVWDNTRPQTHTVASVGNGAELAFAPDSRTLNVVSHGQRRQFDVSSGVEISDSEPTTRLHTSEIRNRFPRGDTLVSPDGNWIGLARENWLDILRMSDGESLHRIELNDGSVDSAAVSPNGKSLAIVTARYHRFGTPVDETRAATLRVYDAQTFELTATVKLPQAVQEAGKGCQHCRFNSDGSLLAATFNGVGANSEVVIVDMKLGDVVERIPVLPTTINEEDVAPYLMEVDFHPTLPRVATLNTNQSRLLSWSLQLDRLKEGPKHELNFSVRTIDGAYSMAYCPVGHRIAVANQHNRVQLLDARSGFDVIVVTSQQKRQTSGNNPRIRFSPNGRAMACFKQGYELAIWTSDVEDNKTHQAAVSKRLIPWHRRKIQRSEATEDFAQRFHMQQLTKIEKSEATQRAAELFHRSRAKIIKPRLYSQGATILEKTYEALPHWLLAAESSFQYSQGGDLQGAYRMAPAAVDTLLHPQATLFATYNPHVSFGQYQHDVISLHLAGAIAADDPQAFEKTIVELIPQLDPRNPIHAATASMAIYGLDKADGFDWTTAQQTVRELGYYPGVTVQRFVKQPRTLFIGLQARLCLLNGDEKEAIQHLDLILKGDEAYENRVAVRTTSEKRRHERAVIVHEKVEARLLKVLALRQLNKPDEATAEFAIAQSDWESVAEPTALLPPWDGLKYWRQTFIRSLLRRLAVPK